MEKITIHVQKMHCRSCELIIDSELLKVNGVKKTKPDFRGGLVEIYYDSVRPKMADVENAIEKAGYKIGDKENSPLFSKNINDYRDLSVAFLLLVIIYYAFKYSGIVDFNLPQISSNLPMIFLVGLAAGISTCMALIGGLVLSFSARHAEKHPEASEMQNFRPHIFFNIGRILGFGVLGGLLGTLGSVLQLSAFATGLIMIFVGIVMLVMGLQLIEIFPRLESWRLTLPKGLAKLLGIKNDQREYSHKAAFITGALTFFLPCGFTQAMQLLAVESGSFVSGAAVMTVFALGTAPGLLGIGGLASFVKGAFAKKFFKFAGLAVIFFSLFNISNAYSLLGVNFDFQNFSGNGQGQNSQNGGGDNIQTEDDAQIIRMSALRGYSPNKFTVKKGVPVKWIINVENPYTCAASIIAPKIGLRKTLNAGENIIEFTPQETGAINFSCAMGMYRGVINVVN